VARDYEQARALAASLMRDGACRSVVLVPPNRICHARELLLPFEYFELMEFITDRMHNADAFVVLGCDDYWTSYWTRMEVLQWRRFTNRPRIWLAETAGAGTARLTGSADLESLPGFDKRLWAHAAILSNRRMQGPRTLNPTGRYAKSCFLVPCATCRRHFLASQRYTYAQLRASRPLACPHGNCAGRVGVSERPSIGTFYRNPVVLTSALPPDMPAVDQDTLLDLLMRDDLPAGMDLRKEPDEWLPTDLTKILIGVGMTALAAIAIVGAVDSIKKLWDELR
jgi:hypothetical protein